ncbi:MAG: DUF3854 domain-containing protein, partial [Planctomycetaceae bacterium]|nr:DUF3854 domain-containing protein [Planctomycetaceae bacterium]
MKMQDAQILSDSPRPAAQWTTVTPSDLCAICGKGDWCGHDGDTYRCMRVADGATSHDDAGGHVHHTGERNEKPEIPATTSELAGPGDRHAVYSALLAELPLFGYHNDALKARGLSGEQMALRKYRSVKAGVSRGIFARLLEKFGTKLMQVPGFIRRDGRYGPFLTLACRDCILIPVRDEQGRIVALKYRQDKVSGKQPRYAYLSSKKNGGPGPGSPPHVPVGVAWPIPRARVTEGELKGDVATCLSPLPTIAIGGVASWRGVLSVLHALGVKTVVVAFDADAATNATVADNLCRMVAGLRKEGFVVEVETWPAEQGKGIDDLLAAGGVPTLLTSEAAIDAHLAQLPTKGSGLATISEGDSRPTIVIGTDEHRVNDESVAALSADHDLYQRAGSLVQIVADGFSGDGIERPASAPRIAAVGPATIRERLTRHARYVRLEGDAEEPEEKPAHPPDWNIKAVCGRGQWAGIRALDGITTAPVLRGDGTVLTLPGYDPATGLYLDLRGLVVEVAEHPTRDDARAAIRILEDVTADFPFERPEHGAGWLAFVLTPLARPAFNGPAPLFLVDANVRGSGKSLLCDTVGMIVTGDALPRMSNPNDDDEARKRITSLAIRGDALCLIDNIASQLGCASLDAALTATRWQDRLLGRSEMVDFPLRLVWGATGNNVILAADTSRRVQPIRLDCKIERPEERSGFRHPHLVDHVRRNRGRLLSAALTVLRAFHVAGRPSQRLPEWGSFEGWSNLIRNALVWAGQPDPAAVRQELVDRSDVQAAALRSLIDGWDEVDPTGDGVTTAKLLTVLARDAVRCEAVHTAICELTNAK